MHCDAGPRLLTQAARRCCSRWSPAAVSGQISVCWWLRPNNCFSCLALRCTWRFSTISRKGLQRLAGARHAHSNHLGLQGELGTGPPGLACCKACWDPQTELRCPARLAQTPEREPAGDVGPEMWPGDSRRVRGALGHTPSSAPGLLGCGVGLCLSLTCGQQQVCNGGHGASTAPSQWALGEPGCQRSPRRGRACVWGGPTNTMSRGQGGVGTTPQVGGCNPQGPQKQQVGKDMRLGGVREVPAVEPQGLVLAVSCPSSPCRQPADDGTRIRRIPQGRGEHALPPVSVPPMDMQVPALQGSALSSSEHTS